MSAASPATNGRPDAECMSVLVTGAAGFIGSHLCDRLLADGHGVWGLDNFDSFYSPEVKRANLQDALRLPSMHLVEGDIRDEILLNGLMSDIDFDAVVHLAARPGVRASIEDPGLCFDVNVQGTLTLLQAMGRHDLATLVFGSSSSVYGDHGELPFEETAAADRPISPYASSKRSAELLCHTYAHLYAISVHCLRFFTVYGPRQRPDLAIHKFSRLIAAGERLPLYGDGSSRRDYTHVDDIVEGIVLSITRLVTTRNSDDPEFEIVNLGNDSTVTLAELVTHLEASLDIDAKMENVGEQPGDVTVTRASRERARELLGYAPEIDFADGIRAFAEWFQSKPETHRVEQDGTNLDGRARDDSSKMRWPHRSRS